MVFGHSYKISKHITHHVKEYKCQCCGETFTTSSEGGIIKLTQKLQNINTVLADLHNRKMGERNSRLGKAKLEGVEGVKVNNPKNLLFQESLQKSYQSKVIRMSPD